jgi:GT2 family glycosyltransferase
MVPPQWVFVLDNASKAEDFLSLRRSCNAMAESELRLYHSPVNLGFSGGCNFLVDELLAVSDCSAVCFLNNDAIAMPGMVGRLMSALLANPDAGLVGGRMHKLARREDVDTLGISIYASLMPADRKDTADPYLGPTGGCFLVARAVVQRLIEVSGYLFDERYFCYCEDTDLVLRSVLLGYRPAYVDDLIALHEGQASTGGGHNRFIAYHGLRNAMWMHWKLMPASLLLKYGVLLALAHVLSAGKLLLNGEFRLLWSIYRDALKRWPEFTSERRDFQRHRTLSASALDALVAPRFYRKGYLALSLRQLRSRYARKLSGKRWRV